MIIYQKVLKIQISSKEFENTTNFFYPRYKVRKKESVDFEIRGVSPWCFEKYTTEKHPRYKKRPNSNQRFLTSSNTPSFCRNRDRTIPESDCTLHPFWSSQGRDTLVRFAMN